LQASKFRLLLSNTNFLTFMARRKKPTEEEINENLNQSNESSDDTFGLPEIDYKPLDRVEETTTTVTETTTVYSSEPEQEQEPVQEVYSVEGTTNDTPPPMEEYVYEEEASPIWPKVLGILIVVLLALGAVWYFMVYKPKADEAKARVAKEAEAREKHKNDSIANANAAAAALAAAEKAKADSLANVSKVGVFEILTERTGRYYVVAASAVDDDLLIDHAKKLEKKGVSTKLIPPFRKYKVYRLTIADADSFAAAQQLADAKKAEYTDALWVLKY
jgi:hypothetical protein